MHVHTGTKPILVADPGEGPLSFRPNWSPKGWKTFFRDRPPLSKGLDDRPPPYLKVWIRHCIRCVTLHLCVNRSPILSGMVLVPAQELFSITWTWPNFSYSCELHDHFFGIFQFAAFHVQIRIDLKGLNNLNGKANMKWSLLVVVTWRHCENSLHLQHFVNRLKLPEYA